ncbi:MAG: GNAT family N-acetyltransferase [Bdellovibrionales bacterium]|nr:GNAT family N-acetyltransferase [Bdellovibrionales bacterium]
MNIEIKTFSTLNAEVLNDVFSLEELIFDKPYSKEKLLREASVKHHLLVLIAYCENKPVGYKIGFELSSRLFYSWIGGVHPEYRGKGLAKRLMEVQHSLIPNFGHSCVRTYTENKYKEMLVLNLKSGFDIIGVYKSDHDEKQTIMLEKML